LKTSILVGCRPIANISRTGEASPASLAAMNVNTPRRGR
jgi:hypothetical protein